MKLKTLTLGCKVNQYETEFVREGLLGAGYADAGEETADLCIVNTCTVTSTGDSKSRQAIRQLSRHNPDARIVVMGCYATRAPGEVAALPGVVEVVTDKRELPDLLGRFGVVDIPDGISRFGDRHRAYVKVQDGCMLKCSFCIIPTVRPHLASRPAVAILDEIRRLVDNGYREIVLTGIHLGHYGVDFNRGRKKSEWMRLANLLAEIARIDGRFRVRLSSIEATEVTRELVEVMATHPDRICPHLHISMQSGSDTVLRRMRRRWGADRFVDRCRLVQDTLDFPALTTDVIVGFPGETDAEFDETFQVCGEVGFSKLHVFPFSARRGTPAAEMSGQIPKAEKQARGRKLGELELQLRQQYFERLAGKTLEVLVESPLDEPSESVERSSLVRHVGTSCRYAPVELAATAADEGQLVCVLAGPIVNGRLSGFKTVTNSCGSRD